MRQFGDGDGFRNVNVLDDSLRRRLEIGFAVVAVRLTAATFGTAAPAITPARRTGRAAWLDAARSATLFSVVRPGGRYVGGLDRLLVGAQRLFLVFFLARLFVSRLVQRAFRDLGLDGGNGRRNWLRSLDRTARRIHHGLDLGHFVSHGLACLVVRFHAVGSDFGSNGSLFLGFFGGSFLGFVVQCSSTSGRSRCGSSSGALGFVSCFLLGVGLGLLGLRFFFSVELGQAFLLFTQVRFLAHDQFGLLARFVFTARHFSGVDDRCGRRRGSGRRNRFIALHEGAHFLDRDLDGARFTGGVSLLDLSRFLARQRDFLLLAFARHTMGAAQVVQQLILIIFRQWI